MGRRCGWAVVTGLTCVGLVAGCTGTTSPASPSAAATAALPPLSQMLADQVLGSASAPVTVIEVLLAHLPPLCGLRRQHVAGAQVHLRRHRTGEAGGA